MDRLAQALDAYVQPHGYCLANFDPTLVIASDLANLGTSGAYVLGFPFCAWRLFPVVPKHVRLVYILGIAFVYVCGLGHMLDTIITHQATYLLYAVVIGENLLTAAISWAFVIAVFHATRRHGLRLIADGLPGADRAPRAPA